MITEHVLAAGRRYELTRFKITDRGRWRWGVDDPSTRYRGRSMSLGSMRANGVRSAVAEVTQVS